MATGKEIKNVNLTIRVTPSELDEIREYAASVGMPYSEFCMNAIKVAMGKKEMLTLESLAERLAAIEAKLDQTKAA